MANRIPLDSIHRLVWLALLAALTAVGAMISVPLGPISPVPVSLQTLFVLLAGLILGPRYGALAMLLYLAAGCLGLPVFAGGKSGIGALLGPTGGFIFGFVPAAFCCGLAHGAPVKSLPILIVYCTLSTALVLLCGTVHLMATLHISLTAALAIGTTPFLPGAVAKILAASFLYRIMAARRLTPA